MDKKQVTFSHGYMQPRIIIYVDKDISRLSGLSS